MNFFKPKRGGLYLSSVGLPDSAAFLRLLRKKAPRRIAIISTAWNPAPLSKRQPFINATISQISAAGLEHGFIDLAQFGGKTADLRAALTPCAAIWVTGGNSFYLNYWMHQSGFDHIIGELLGQGMVYGGESAGAVVAGKTLHGIELLDDPRDAPEIMWEGLGLVNFGIIPHWGKEKYADRNEQARQEMQQFSKVMTLGDGEHIVQ